MQTSARNQLVGTISKIVKGAVSAEVTLTLQADVNIVASVTVGSIDALELQEGKTAYAIVKAPQVILVHPASKLKFSTRNRLSGKVIKIEKGAVNSLVALQLTDGSVLKSIVTQDAVVDLNIKEGDDLIAIFKASSVILAVET